MPLWDGPTWTCENQECRFVNAEIRTRCRNCGRLRPLAVTGPYEGPED